MITQSINESPIASIDFSFSVYVFSKSKKQSNIFFI
jgi:hypothetical protein